LHDKINIEEINELVNNHLNIINESSVNITNNNYFYGKKVVLTGTLKNFTRQKAEEIIESLGGTSSTSVTSQTNIVLVGENAGSKLEKAKKLGIQIMYEDEFLTKIPKN